MHLDAGRCEHYGKWDRARIREASASGIKDLPPKHLYTPKYTYYYWRSEPGSDGSAGFSSPGRRERRIGKRSELRTSKDFKAQERPWSGAGQASHELKCDHDFRFDRGIFSRVCIRCGLVSDAKYYAPVEDRVPTAKARELTVAQNLPRPGRLDAVFQKAYTEICGRLGIKLSISECIEAYKSLIRLFRPRTEYEVGGCAILAVWICASSAGIRRQRLSSVCKEAGKRLRYYKHFVAYRRQLRG